MVEPIQRYAVVTGSNKGIGLEIVRQLASAGINVVLTARDEKRGLQALETLKSFGLSDFVVFHQLDVANAASVATLADFVKSQFGKLDILVNNAGVSGVVIKDSDLFHQAIMTNGALSDDEMRRAMTETYELAKECIQINYGGAKTTFEYLLPLLQLSDSPRVVNVSSALGMIKYVSNEWAKAVFNDVDNLTEERIDEVLKEFINDFEEGSLQKKGWPRFFASYTLAKASMNAYTRIIAKKNPTFCINCVCPGYVKTDITGNTGLYTTEEGAARSVRLTLLPNGSPSGLFYIRNEVSSF
ncbi:(+)-neomenthol dehydrogenase [Trifolium repens]|nr:(+)-neomenthol dehydrogenase [Trifolium repens]